MARESRDRCVKGYAGLTKPIYIPVKSGETIKTGDLVKCGAGVDVEAMDAAGDNVANDNFCGVAMQDSVSADPATIRVATDGVFEFDCASDTHVAGEFVTETGSDAQLVIGTNDLTTGGAAIGRVWKTVGTAATKVRVRIMPIIKFANPT